MRDGLRRIPSYFGVVTLPRPGRSSEAGPAAPGQSPLQMLALRPRDQAKGKPHKRCQRQHREHQKGRTLKAATNIDDRKQYRALNHTVLPAQ